MTVVGGGMVLFAVTLNLTIKWKTIKLVHRSSILQDYTNGKKERADQTAYYTRPDNRLLVLLHILNENSFGKRMKNINNVEADNSHSNYLYIKVIFIKSIIDHDLIFTLCFYMYCFEGPKAHYIFINKSRLLSCNAVSY